MTSAAAPASAGLPSQMGGWQVPSMQFEPNTHWSVGAHEPPTGTVPTHVPAPASASKEQIPPAHTVGVGEQSPPGCTTTTGPTQRDATESQSADAAVGSQKKTDESHASPRAGSFAQVCVVWSQWPSTGQTLSS
jgi:hypothetical protein